MSRYPFHPPGSTRNSSSKKPRTLRRPVFAHERIASEATRRLGQIGIPLDYSPPSLAGIDCYLTILLPSGDQMDAIHSELEDQILLFGSYVGETFRKQLGGDWHDVGTGEDIATRIQIILPEGDACYPLLPVRERLLRRTEGIQGCLDTFEELRENLGLDGDSAQDAPLWVRFAEVLFKAGQSQEALRLLLRATKLDSALGTAWFLRGQVEEKLGHPHHALSSYQKAQETLPGGEPTLGEVLFRLSQLEAIAPPPPSNPPSSSPPNEALGLELIPELSSSFPQAIFNESTIGSNEPTIANSESTIVKNELTKADTGITEEIQSPLIPSKVVILTDAHSSTPAVSIEDYELPAEDMHTIPPPPTLPDLPPNLSEIRNAPSIRVEMPRGFFQRQKQSSPQEKETLGESLLDLARKGEIEFLDALLDETRSDWDSNIEAELFSWLEQMANEGTIEKKRSACGNMMQLADRKGFRPSALAQETESSLRLLERVSLSLGAALPSLSRAKLMLALAASFSDRIEGDSEKNQKEALHLVESSLFLIDARANPEILGQAHKLLGNIHRKRSKGSRKDHSETALGAYRAALRVFASASLMEPWATVQIDIGNTLRERHSGDRNENNELAIEALTAAFTVLNREEHPINWGLGKLALGQCFLERDVGDRAASFERAIMTLQEAVDVLPPGTIEACTAHHRLGLAYQRRKAGDRRENLLASIQHYEQGIESLPLEERRSAEENLDAARQELKRKQRS